MRELAGPQKSAKLELRLQVKQKEGEIDHQMAARKVDQASDAAQTLGRSKDAEFEYSADHGSEHGSVHVTVKSKRASPCFVATACYGNESHPAVIALRHFRDDFLRHGAAGRLFIAWYYRNSPALANRIERNAMLRFLGRVALWPAALTAATAVWLRQHFRNQRVDQTPR